MVHQSNTLLGSYLALVPCSLAELMSSQRCHLATAICDFSIVVAFGHNELWQLEAANRVSSVVAEGPQSSVANLAPLSVTF